MSIQSIIDGVIAKEAGYVDNPNDRGGKTNFGITDKVARAAGYTGDMRDLPRQLAFEIYTKDYVIAPGFDKIAAVSMEIAEELIDTGVNMGPGLPGPWLQRILTMLNAQGKMYTDLVVDGQIGPATISALRAQIAKRGKDGVTVILRMLNAMQCVRYIEITESRPQNRAFLFGWILGRVS